MGEQSNQNERNKQHCQYHSHKRKRIDINDLRTARVIVIHHATSIDVEGSGTGCPIANSDPRRPTL